MLNLFPIQFLAPLTYFLLRITLGFLCIRIGFMMMRAENASKKRRFLGTLFTGAGSLLFLGLYTQGAALLTLLLSGVGVFRSGTVHELTRTSLVLMCVIAVTLFVTGSGPFAFDLPI
jgi:hypothetical protein